MVADRSGCRLATRTWRAPDLDARLDEALTVVAVGRRR
jgi:hypothetical protein